VPDNDPARSAADDYFTALGRFIHGYARLEVGLHVLFRHCAGLGDAGRVLSARESADRVMRMTGDIARARNLEQSIIDQIQDVFAQIRHISVLRNSLIHRGAEIYGDNIISSDVMTARTVGDAQILPLNLADIQAATSDCGTAFLRLAAVVTPDAPNLNTDEAREALARAWAYKPLQQERPYQTPDATAGGTRQRLRRPRRRPDRGGC
jgi:hypothetical protein